MVLALAYCKLRRLPRSAIVVFLSLAVVTSHNVHPRRTAHAILILIRAALIALTVTGAGLATAAYAAAAASASTCSRPALSLAALAGGTLVFHGRRYPLSIGG